MDVRADLPPPPSPSIPVHLTGAPRESPVVVRRGLSHDRELIMQDVGMRGWVCDWRHRWKEKLSRTRPIILVRRNEEEEEETKTRSRTQTRNQRLLFDPRETHPKFQKSSPTPPTFRRRGQAVRNGINIKEGRTDRQMLRKVEAYVEPVKCVRLNCWNRLCTGVYLV